MVENEGNKLENEGQVYEKWQIHAKLKRKTTAFDKKLKNSRFQHIYLIYFSKSLRKNPDITTA